ncbi:MAG: hypothetical protein ACE5KH_05010, partial [Candidatus Geothermarchaeales archaeon]
LVEGVLARVRQSLESLVDDGQLSPEDVDVIIDEMRQEADYHLDRVFSDDEFRPIDAPFSVEDLAHILGLEPSELFAQFQEGKSLLQIAQDHGFSKDRLLETIMSLAQQRAQRLVDQGAMQPEDVERFLRQLREDMEHHIEETSPRYDVAHEEFPLPQRILLLFWVSACRNFSPTLKGEERSSNWHSTTT